MSDDTVNIALYYFFGGTALLFGIPFFYIVISKSPPSLRLYRNTILNLTIWYFLAIEICGLFLQPTFAVVDSKLCAKYLGPASSMGTPAVLFLLFACLFSASNVGIAMCICFIYRFVQISDFSIPRCLTSFRLAALCAAFHVVSAVIVGLLTYLFGSCSDMVMTDGAVHMCHRPGRNYFAMMVISGLSVVGLIVATIAIGALGAMTIRALRSQRMHMSKQTYRMHLLLTANLVMLVALPIVFDVVPLIASSLCIFFQSDTLLFYTVSISSHAPFIDVILSCVLTVAFITPYRKAVKRMLCKSKAVFPSVPVIFNN
ncbi:hypothetical protein QR680_015419 [Steinernema hermaphroditum]|uniref:Uncharacterized protein n=1 Tax=Steinernema hermaphroditum TaxID=289476 RepID=A0AA39HA66_9BILA|nr:hypothetical protein QR680_015419 [Steinernema hermaphroditum]